MFPPIRNRKPKKSNQIEGLCSTKPNIIQVKPKNGEFEEKPKKCFCF